MAKYDKGKLRLSAFTFRRGHAGLLESLPQSPQYMAKELRVFGWYLNVHDSDL